MSKLKIGILGATRGVDFAYGVLANHPLAEVTAVCENFLPLKQKLENELAGAGRKIRVFSQFDEMLASGIDAVVIANFSNEHAPYAIKALQNNVHVLSECLPTQTMKEAVELYEAAENSSALYAYGENYCYLPYVWKMRQIYESGELGQVMLAEGDFINDCSMRWHLLTRGNRNHWRNHVPSTFYCTHSIGPMLYITGTRAVNVVGMETPLLPHMAEGGARSGSAAMEIFQLNNGAMGRSINGNYRRSYSADYRFICEQGTMETDRFDMGKIRISTPNKQTGGYDLSDMRSGDIYGDLVSSLDLDKTWPHILADHCMINVFVRSILKDADVQKYMITAAQALDMSTIGLLAYRSILNGSAPIAVPDLRNQADRDLWRNDNKCTDPTAAQGADLLPSSKNGFVDVDDSVYEQVANTFNDTPLTTGMH